MKKKKQEVRPELQARAAAARSKDIEAFTLTKKV